MKEFSAPEARQGVAVDASHFYAVVNNVVAKYEKGNGARVAYWASPRGGLIRHINSCIADAAKLWCANSNFPETPMASSVEVIDSATMMHIESHSMGLMEEGSLTFFERLGAGWVAGFAHYDGEGGLAYKNSAFAGISTFDADWRRTGGWMLPESVRVRMGRTRLPVEVSGPMAISTCSGTTGPKCMYSQNPRWDLSCFTWRPSRSMSQVRPSRGTKAPSARFTRSTAPPAAFGCSPYRR